MSFILFVFVTELVKAYFIQFIPNVLSPHDTIYALAFFYISQLIGSPIEGHLADRWGYKLMLLVSFCSIALSQLGAIWFSYVQNPLLLFAAVIVYGFAGNADLISRSLIINLYQERKKKMLMGLSFVVLPFAWILSAVFLQNPLKAKIPTAILCLCIVCIVLAGLKKNKTLVKTSTESLFEFLKTQNFAIGVFAFLISEIAFQLMFLRQDILFSHSTEKYTILSAAGFAIGALAQMNRRLSEKNGTLLGIFLSAVFLLIDFLIKQFFPLSWVDLFIGYSFFALSSGIYLPAVFFLYSKKFSLRNQGKVFGVLDSISTLGEVLAILILTKKMSTNMVTVASTTLFALSFGIFYFLLKGNKKH